MVFSSNFYSRAVLDSITGQIWPAGRLLRTPGLTFRALALRQTNSRVVGSCFALTKGQCSKREVRMHHPRTTYYVTSVRVKSSGVHRVKLSCVRVKSSGVHRVKLSCVRVKSSGVHRVKLSCVRVKSSGIHKVKLSGVRVKLS